MMYWLGYVSMPLSSLHFGKYGEKNDAAAGDPHVSMPLSSLHFGKPAGSTGPGPVT